VVLVSDPSEREKWEADVRLREREIAVREREAAAKAEELRRSRWREPIVLAVLAAALAAGGNAVVAVINGNLQRAADERHSIAENKLQTAKGSEERQLEEGKAEAARILEVVKTNNPDKAAENLKFLLETGLLTDPARRASMEKYLASRRSGTGVVLPTAADTPSKHWLMSEITRFYQGNQYTCKLKEGVDVALLKQQISDSINSSVSILDPLTASPDKNGVLVAHTDHIPVNPGKGPSQKLRVLEQSAGLEPEHIDIQTAEGPDNTVTVAIPDGLSSHEEDAELVLTPLRKLSKDPTCAVARP
jgi:hypothetical protein